MDNLITNLLHLQNVGIHSILIWHCTGDHLLSVCDIKVVICFNVETIITIQCHCSFFSSFWIISLFFLDILLWIDFNGKIKKEIAKLPKTLIFRSDVLRLNTQICRCCCYFTIFLFCFDINSRNLKTKKINNFKIEIMKHKIHKLVKWEWKNRFSVQKTSKNNFDMFYKISQLIFR